jgi:hypothetical protein
MLSSSPDPQLASVRVSAPATAARVANLTCPLFPHDCGVTLVPGASACGPVDGLSPHDGNPPRGHLPRGHLPAALHPERGAVRCGLAACLYRSGPDAAPRCDFVRPAPSLRRSKRGLPRGLALLRKALELDNPAAVAHEPDRSRRAPPRDRRRGRCTANTRGHRERRHGPALVRQRTTSSRRHWGQVLRVPPR